MTGLEAIAQKLEEKRKTDLESILSISGSQSIAKNQYNVTVIDENNIASSLLFKELIKPKYDEVELVKAIDLTVKELKPNIPTSNLELVPKPLYDEVVIQNEDLRNQVASLTLDVDTLTTTINDLESQVQTEINNRLGIEQSNDALVNQLTTLTQTIDDFTSQIQSALQKSVEEGILRASLQSQNTGFKAQIQALMKQIDSLNSIIEGLQSQLGAVQTQQAIVQGTQSQAMASSADVLNDVAIVKFEPRTDFNKPIIWARYSSKGNSMWKNGQSITITNNDKTPIKVELVSKNPINPTGPAFYKIPERTFTVSPGSSKNIEFELNYNATLMFDSRDKTPGGSSKSVEYMDGELKVIITRENGISKTKTYATGFGKYHPDSY
jgi:hypothetical protein